MFSYFSIIGGVFFQLWQVGAGNQPLRDAFQFVMLCGLAMIYLGMDED